LPIEQQKRVIAGVLEVADVRAVLLLPVHRNFGAAHVQHYALWRFKDFRLGDQLAIDRGQPSEILVLGEQVSLECLQARRQSRTTAQFFALTALPGPPLTRRLAEGKRIIAGGGDWQLFDAHIAVVCPSRISPSELQAGIFRLSRQFYSPSEALRHLIQGRWFDFAIRLRGSFLTRRIKRDSASYTRALDKFDQVRADLTTELDKLVEKARTRLREFGVGLEDDRARAEAGFEDMFRQFELTCDRLNLKLIPYGQALRDMTSKKLEKYLRASATEPHERKSLNLADAPDNLYP
jgi:hypothetical protein